MNSRKYPRTLAEAFGPYETGPIHDPHQRQDWFDAFILVLSVVGIVAVFALVVGGVL